MIEVVLAPTLLTLSLVLAEPTPAPPPPPPKIEGGDSSFDAEGRVGEPPGSQGGRGSRKQSPSDIVGLDIQYLCNRGSAIATGCQPPEVKCKGGYYALIIEIRRNGDRVPRRGIECYRDGQRVASITPGMVLREFKRVPLPGSRIRVQPPGGATLVNLATIFSTQAGSFRRVLTLLGQRVELAVRPSRFVWSHGDGSSQVSAGPGAPWREGLPMEGYISHDYTQTGVVRVGVDTTWSARFRVEGGPWRDVGGTVTVEGVQQRLVVREAPPRLEDPYD